ncbi:hypothetical protein K503DRAFT_725367 [Rhizopogon vinicolor AM-OR11-026]|uniref:Restriction of telomere capping protein 4 n=1 Tax=Rhizopogon vinicolor AM-OR11-026 TaxID=1314800 RepID=A0A1B7MMH8_9AGAM|nr:hypothetical protein K503DRAFT_725367 [Rhizopogon vinicolor AM-OR11-026]
MERLVGQLDRKKTNLYSDSSHRMKERPYSVQSGQGRGHEDFGSSFAPSQPVLGKATTSKVTTSKVKPTTSHLTSKSLERDLSDDSDDELSLGMSLAHKRVIRGKATVSISQETNLAPNGLPYHPDFLPNKKLPNFTKIKKVSQVKDIPEAPPSSSLPDPDDSQELFRPISDDLPPQILPSHHTARSTREKHAGSSKCTIVRLDGSSLPPTNKKVSMHQNPVERSSKKPTSPSPLSEDEPSESIQRPIQRSQPVKAGRSNIRDRSPEATPRAIIQPQPFPLAISPAYSGSSSASDAFPPQESAREASAAIKENAELPISKRKEKKNALSRQQTAPFPMSPPGMLNLPVKQPLLDPKAPKPFPLPLQKQALARLDTLDDFPAPSPLTSPVQPPSLNKGKGRALVLHPDEGHIDELATGHTAQIKGALRPFPMNSQEIKTAPRSSPQSPSGSTRSKRTSDDSDRERGRKVKRHKEDNQGHLARLILREEDQLEEDSVELDRVVDPSTVCPYCDEPLPHNPTPQLKTLLATAKRKSHADPRPRNPCGLKAPLGVYISACQRHHFETHILPEAIENGWPQSINFKKVPKRVEGMKGALEAIIADADKCNEDEDSGDVDPRDLRIGSFFWREVKKEIKKQGSRTVTGVKGQFTSFEKTQPGYYGELGSLIIHQTLYNLFPFSSFNASSIAPFTPAEFIQRVLVPEAAVGLIMQDLHLDKDEAIVTLRESSQYGVAMFPDTGTGKGAAFGADDDDEGVADRIVMERAKARRLEIEEEEKIEEQMWKEEQAKRRSTAQTERKERARQRAEQLKKSRESAEYTSREVSEASESESQHRRFKKTSKARSMIATDSDTDNIPVDSFTSRRSSRSKTGTMRMYQAASTKPVSSDMQISDDSSVEIVEEGRQPQVRRSSRRAASSGIARTDDVGQLSDASSSKTRSRQSKSLRGDDLDTNTHIGDTPLKPVPEVDEESTPRPRWSRAPTVLRPHPTLGSSGATASNRFPLQVARSRSVTSAASDVWRKNLTSGRSEAEDSDDSQAHHWLLSPSSSPSP